MRMRVPIRTRMLLAIALPATLVYIAAAVLTLRYARAAALARVSSEAAEDTRYLARRFDSFLRKASLVPEATARFITTVPDLTEDELYELMRSNVSLDERFYGAAIAFVPGKYKPGDSLFCPYVFRGGPDTPGESIGDGLRRMDIDEGVLDYYRDPRWEWFAEPKETRQAGWTSPYQDEGAGSVLMVTYSAPFFDPGGELRGVTTIDINLESFRREVADRITGGREFAILESDGGYIYAPDVSQILGGNAFDDLHPHGSETAGELLRNIVGGATGVSEVDYWDSAEPEFLSYSPIGTTGWSLVTSLPLSVAMEPYRETRRVLAGAYLGGLALILGSVLVTSARLSRPVNELTRRVAKIAEGDKDETVSDIQSDDEIGDLATAFGTMQEKVSDREERLLKARETTLTELLESAPEAMLITGADGTVCRTNSKAEALFGYGSGQLGGIEISRLLPEPAAGGRPAGRRHDGSEFPAETSVSPFQDPAGPMEIRVVRDISERLAREAELLDAREAAEAATRAKGEFLSHMSHELRTPLNGVLGYAQILMRDPSSTPSQRENLDAIVSCSDHLLGLINDVLDLSRIEAGRVEVDLKPTDLHRVVQGVADIVGQRARGAGLEFTTEIGDGLPRHVVTDGPKLRQVLVNLLGNAVKFTPSGSVKLSVHERPEGKLRIEVADTGIGMTDRELAEIFDPFKQVEAGKAAGGTGLGLAISRHLCESLGGELTATSVPREGSTFSVTLPLERAEGVAQLENIAPRGEAGLAPAAPLRLAREGSSTVLIVDDRESNRDVLSKMLKSSGFATETAVNGAEALEMLRTDPARFDLVLMDLAMPVLDGTSTVKAIRADPQLRGLAVIAVTASAGPDFREQAVADGFDDALSKPLRFEALADSLRRHTRIDFAGESESESGSSRAPAAAAREPAGSAAELPASAVDALTGALKIRSLTAINQLASELAADASTAAAGKEIRELAKKFDFKGLEALLERMG